MLEQRGTDKEPPSLLPWGWRESDGRLLCLALTPPHLLHFTHHSPQHLGLGGAGSALLSVRGGGRVLIGLTIIISTTPFHDSAVMSQAYPSISDISKCPLLH